MAGADLEWCTASGRSPLQCLCAHSHGVAGKSRESIYDYCRLLLELGADPDAAVEDVEGHRCIEGVIEGQGFTLTCKHMDPRLFELLVEAGADVEPILYRDTYAPYSDGRADTNYVIRLSESDDSDSLRMLQCALNAGADPHATGLFSHRYGFDSDQPLHYATICDNVAAMKLLIEAGACVDALTVGGLRPVLHAAVLARATAVQLLLAAKASLKLANEHHKLMCYASRFSNAAILKLLLDAGADPLDHAADCDEKAGSALGHVVMYQDGDALKVVLDAIGRHFGDDKDAAVMYVSGRHLPKTTFPPSAGLLHGACWNKTGRKGLVAVLFSHPLTASTSRTQVNVPVDWCGEARRTPLFLACRRSHGDLVLELLAAGADANIRDARGTAPLRALKATASKPRNQTPERKASLQAAIAAFVAATTAAASDHLGPVPSDNGDSDGEAASGSTRFMLQHHLYSPGSSCIDPATGMLAPLTDMAVVPRIDGKGHDLVRVAGLSAANSGSRGHGQGVVCSCGLSHGHDHSGGGGGAPTGTAPGECCIT